jgi:hypothetical protein
MERVEQRLEIVLQEKNIGNVKMQTFQLIERLELPELDYQERLAIAAQLREAFGSVNEHPPLNEKY